MRTFQTWSCITLVVMGTSAWAIYFDADPRHPELAQWCVPNSEYLLILEHRCIKHLQRSEFRRAREVRAIALWQAAHRKEICGQDEHFHEEAVAALADAEADILAPPDKYWPNFELSIDNKISVTEFAQELRDRSGLSYAVLFDTAQWQQIWGAAVATTVYGDDHIITAEDLRCLRDYLLEAGDRIEVRTEVKPGDWSIPPFGRIIFDWPGREKTIFGHPNADPGFYYIDGRWDITTYFGYRG